MHNITRRRQVNYDVLVTANLTFFSRSPATFFLSHVARGRCLFYVVCICTTGLGLGAVVFFFCGISWELSWESAGSRGMMRRHRIPPRHPTASRRILRRVPGRSRAFPRDLAGSRRLPWRSHLASGGIPIHRKSRETSHENPTEFPRYFPPVFSWDPRSLDIPLTLNPTRYP